MDNKSGEIRTKTCSSVFICWLRIPSRFSPCKNHSRQMAQTSGFDPMSQVKTCFDCKMFDVANWVARSTEKMVPEGHLHMRPFQFHLKEHWRKRDHFSTPRLVAKSHKHDERCRLSSQSSQYPTLYRCLK